MSRNSVLEEFSVRRFAVILDDSEGDLYWSRSYVGHDDSTINIVVVIIIIIIII